jgi:transposase-like protein
MNTYKELIQAFKDLTEVEKQLFVNHLVQQVREDLSIHGIKKDLSLIQGTYCPHCQSQNIYANGKLKAIQRYVCKDCKKNFSERTGTALAWIKKQHLWPIYVRNMFEGYSLEKCAKLTGISKQTSFDWRHKILSSLRSLSPKEFSGISEIDDIFFNYSEKGSRNLEREARKRGNDHIQQGISHDKVTVLVTCDRQKHKDLQVIKRGRIRKTDIDSAIGDRLDKESTVCTDSHRSFTGYAKDKGLNHKQIHVRKGQYVKDKIYHLQNVNQTASGLKNWIRRFNGVSTKYLQNYMSWYMVLEQIKNKEFKIKEFATAALVSNQAWPLFKTVSNSYVI